MSLSLIFVCLWIIAANVLAVIPSKDKHWRRAYVLIAVGLPLLVFVYVENGVWITLATLIACASILRWPVRYLWRWVRRQIGG